MTQSRATSPWPHVGVPQRQREFVIQTQELFKKSSNTSQLAPWRSWPKQLHPRDRTGGKVPSSPFYVDTCFLAARRYWDRLGSPPPGAIRHPTQASLVRSKCSHTHAPGLWPQGTSPTAWRGDPARAPLLTPGSAALCVGGVDSPQALQPHSLQDPCGGQLCPRCRSPSLGADPPRPAPGPRSTCPQLLGAQTLRGNPHGESGVGGAALRGCAGGADGLPAT